jgi:hypothetical protein
MATGATAGRKALTWLLGADRHTDSEVVDLVNRFVPEVLA